MSNKEKLLKGSSKDFGRIQEPPNFAIKFANTVFVLGNVFSLLVAVIAVYKIINPPEDITSTRIYYIFFLFATFTVSFFSIGLRRFRNELKVKFSMVLVTLGVCVYGIEIYLEFFKEKLQSAETYAAHLGDPYETRTKFEIIEDLIDAGIEAYPIIGAKFIQTSDGGLFSLGGISNSTTILNNESGYFPIIQTDEHGFINAKDLYKKNKVDFLLTGDSFVNGYAVDLEETISSVLREFGINSLSIGSSGNGPLEELAGIKEYAEPLEPKIILWFYYENDLDILEKMRSPILRKYLDEENFTQNLILRQDEIDSLLKDYFKQKRKNKKDKWALNVNYRLKRIIKGYNIRFMMNLVPSTKPISLAALKFKQELVFFKKILEKSKKIVNGWGGKIYFCNLPSHSSYSTDNKQRLVTISNKFLFSSEKINNNILRIVSELEIPVIDFHSEVFASHPDPLSLFPFRRHGHYTAEGYKLIAEAIAKRIKADGFVTSQSL